MFQRKRRTHPDVVAHQFVKVIETDEEVIEECLEETLNMLEKAQKPVIIADVELVRKRLQEPFRALLERSGYPYGASCV